jgi:hypothetical protein
MNYYCFCSVRYWSWVNETANVLNFFRVANTYDAMCILHLIDGDNSKVLFSSCQILVLHSMCIWTSSFKLSPVCKLATHWQWLIEIGSCLFTNTFSIRWSNIMFVVPLWKLYRSAAVHSFQSACQVHDPFTSAYFRTLKRWFVLHKKNPLHKLHEASNKNTNNHS